MTAGSGLFSKQTPKLAHLLTHGLAAEVADVRQDILDELSHLTPLHFEELLAPAASNTAGLLAATATTIAVQTQTNFLTGSLGTGALAAHPRSIKFTTAGSTASDAPATCVVTGVDVTGAVQTETVTLAQTAASVETVKCYSSLTSVVYAAADGTGATIAIGIGTQLGLALKLKARAGLSALIKEIQAGAFSTTQTDLKVDEWTNPIAASATALLAATATSASPVTVLAASLLSGGLAALLAFPRNLTFTTGASNPTHVPATATITGTDINGNVLTEVVTLDTSAGTASGVKAFKTVVSIAYTAGGGTDATVSIGIGQVFGLSHPVKFRAGTLKPIQEISAGTVVTTGTFANASSSPPNGSYSPAGAPNGSTSYAAYYESLASAGSTVNSATTSAPHGSYVPSTPFDGTTNYCIYYEYDPTAA